MHVDLDLELASNSTDYRPSAAFVGAVLAEELDSVSHDA
jgi:hypothetical protein